MPASPDNAVAIVGVGAIMPDAPDAATFWQNLSGGRYSITEVDPARWEPALYYDADRRAHEKTYSTIGGWVRDWEWNPLGWKLPLMPKVSDAMDDAHKWAVACARMALADAGWPQRGFDADRTATIIGNALSGERHYLTALRISFPEIARGLEHTATFASLPADVRAAIADELHRDMDSRLPAVTEDTMPGELSNCVAGRVANLFNFHGPNFTTDAACASALAAVDAAVQGLVARDFDVAITGGVDRNMGASTFVKFCAIGALSGTGTRPYADGADGFVMGEGAALFVLKRLADAERDADRVYAVIRGVGGSSDGKGKGITAPNPVGQKFAIDRAWQRAGLSPQAGMMIEGHGTSTRAGDVAELQSLGEAFAGAGLPAGSIALGSVKSNIGHLKAAAGAAGMLKATLALHHKLQPPSLNFDRPNPNVDWSALPFAVNTEARNWEMPDGAPRAAGVSAFGFGGTNFHVVLEEHVPGRFNGNGHATVAVPADVPADAPAADIEPAAGEPAPAPERPAAAPAPVAQAPEEPPPPASPPAPVAAPPARGLLLVGAPDAEGLAVRLRAVVEADTPPAPAPPAPEDLRAPERVCIDYGDADELVVKARHALKALESGNPAAWKALQGRGIFRGSGAAGKVAFLYTGQGSQYANMLATLRRTEPVVAATFDEADEIMRPLLDGRRLSDIVFVDDDHVAEAEAQLMRTEITQPAVLTVDIALTRLLAAHGIEPDFVMGHSVGEYGALVAAGVMSFEAALEAVSARGREMASLEIEDPGAMAAVSAPLEEVERIVAETDGYVVLANVNSTAQVVLGGATDAVERAMATVVERGHRAVRLPVSHAFHTEIVAGASDPLRAMLRRLRLAPPQIPVVANLTGDFYPTGPGCEDEFVEILGRQVASQVQFVQGLRTLYAAGARVFVETGPKRALWGFASDVLGDDVMSLFTNHPKVGDSTSFNQALAGLYAAGVGPKEAASPAQPEPVVISGAAVGTPGTERLFDDGNLVRLLDGEQFIHAIPAALRDEILDRHITRLVKAQDGSGSFETIGDADDVIKLAARAGALDLAEEFGIDADRLAALGRDTQLAIAVGIDALRDAGIPLVQHYKDTTLGTKLPDRWLLPDALRDDTGIVFASAFPGLEEFGDELARFWADRGRRRELRTLEDVRARMDGGPGRDEVQRRIAELEAELEREPYTFDRRFLFRVLSMGHSQLAELIGARGPNTQLNAACASTTQAVALAEDWINAGRCRRVLVVAADDATSDTMLPWIGSGFLASGAAATDAAVEDAALPFDQRRHGMLIGMGAAGLLVESAGAARERGVTPICEVLGTVTANSAFHGTRLDVEHIAGVMENVVAQAEARGVARGAIAPETLFVSHETYTPARGGSAAAEIHALRRVFGEHADAIVIANTKGMTGHPMGVGIEDVVAVKALETGLVPAVPNFREVDPDLGALNLSTGGSYPVRYALRLAAGFGSQISMMLLRWTPVRDGRRRSPAELGFAYRVADDEAWQTWLRTISGQEAPELEVVQHRLRVVDRRTAAAPPAEVAPVEDAPAVEEPVAAPLGDEEILEQVLSLVAEQTGYPTDLLDPDLDLEADLGIDTVKQAEVFAAIRERYGIERDDTLALRDYPTLNHVAAFVRERAGRPGAKAAPAPQPPTDEDILAIVLAVVAEQTGYPTDLLDPDLDLEADLGIDTVKQAEVFAAIREHYGIERDDTLALRDYPTLNHVAAFVRERAGAPVAATPVDFAPDSDAKSPDTDGAAAPAPARDDFAPEKGANATRGEASPQPPTDAEILATVLAVVAEQTGYPTDLLDPDLDLEADLGIDTVKQAEVFAAIRQRYGIGRDDTLALRDYPTLNHVAAFVRERAGAPVAATPVDFAPDSDAKSPDTDGDAAPAPARDNFTPQNGANATQAEATPQPPTDEDILATVLAVVAEQTGYPTDLLDPDLDLEADLGIDTVKQAEVFAAIRERYGIERDDALALRDYPTLNHVAAFVRERAGAPAPATPVDFTPDSDANATDTDGSTAAAPARDEFAPQNGAKATQVEATPQPPTDTEILATVLAVVAEQTGYPTDLLDPDLDLEADLGIDTVKQAEVFAAIRERYGIDRDDALSLRDYPTLNHVAQFVRERAGTRETAAPEPEPTLEPVPETPGFPRRVPIPVVRPAFASCASTGVTIGAGTTVLVADDGGGVADALRAVLTARGAELTDDVVSADGVFWLRALDLEPPLEDLTPDAWRQGLQARVKDLASVMRAARPSTFLVAATRFGGRHGYDAAGARSVMGGAVSGFAKALARERANATIKAVDVEAAADADAVADTLLAEAERDPGAVEVGHADGLRWSVGLVERPAELDPAHALAPTDTFVITGAAGSIVSAITADLAAHARGGTFHLLDLVPDPTGMDPDLQRFATDKDALKRDLADRLRARGEKPTPKLVERELAGIERARAALDAIQAIERAGGTAVWHRVDLTSPTEVAEALAGVGPRVDVLLHAAGVEISHALADKPQREFDLVFDVKADGWFNLLHGLRARGAAIGSAVVFSSIAGRFGNAGQTDYSAANDLLCKSVSHLRATTGTRAIAIDWTAWADIGMASRGSIPKVMEMAGIAMLPADAGVPVVRRELTAAGAGAEVVVAGALGVLLEERHPRGGIVAQDLDAVVAGRLERVSATDGIVVTATLDPTAQRFLDDHRIDGTPVMPGVMGMEAFAETAKALLPGWAVVAVEDVDLLAPVKFYRDQPRTLEIRALVTDAGDALVARCHLIGRRTLPGQGEVETVHFTGDVRLAREAPAAPTVALPHGPSVTPVGRDDVYRVYFHGPAYRVLDHAYRVNGEVVGELSASLPPDHARGETEVVPRLIELCFQTAGVHELGTAGRLALPMHVDRMTRFAGADAPGRLRAVVTRGAAGVDADVVDDDGRVRVRLEGYRTIELPGGVDADALGPIREAMS